MITQSDGTPRVAVPSDIGTPDTIAFGLTFRQLAVIGSGGLAGWAGYRTFGHLLPPLVTLFAAVLLAALTVVLALGRRDGLPLDLWLRHGVTLAHAPKLNCPGPAQSSDLATVDAEPKVPAPLRPTATAITPAGVLTADGGDRRLIACGTTNIGLRTGDEQAALIDGFGRFLNALTGPAQLVVSARRHDLTPHAEAIMDAAPRLPHPALQAAANDYAAFLLELDTTREPLRRQVIAVIGGATAADPAVRALSGLGVTATVLDGPAVTAALATAVDPFHQPTPGPRAVPGVPITLRRTS